MIISDFFDDILPIVQEYGIIASGMQAGIRPIMKGGHNEIVSTVTPADFKVQEGILLYLQKYDISLKCEEQTQNAASFPDERPWLVTIDPIDGTYNYSKQLPQYGIIIALYHNETLAGCISHMPASSTTYCATREDAWVHTPETGRQSIALPRCNNRVIITQRLSLEKLAELRSEGFDAYDVDSLERPQLNMHALFQGNAMAYCRPLVPCLDAVPLSYILEMAGWTVTDFAGEKLHRRPYLGDNARDRLPSILMAQDKDTHAAIAEIINRP